MNFFLLLGIANAIQLQEQMQTTTSITAFINSDPMGKMMFEFAQLEMHVSHFYFLEASGAVDILIEVLKAFGRQQEDRLTQENEIWQQRLGDHNARRIQFESLITEGELSINRDRKRLTEELVPRSGELDYILSGLKTKKENNEKAKTNAIAVRTEQNKQFSMQANEISEAIRSTDEALAYIKRCSGGGAFIEEKRVFFDSLAQIKKSASTSTDYMGSLITTLSQIAETQNFADKQVQKQLIELLQSLRSYFVDTLQKAYNDEDQQKLLHQQRLDQLANELGVFDKQYGDAFNEREQVSIAIEDTNQIITRRTKEHQQFVDRLNTENNNFTQNQSIHDKLVADINGEIGFIEKALNVLETQAFKEELQNAINKAK